MKTVIADTAPRYINDRQLSVRFGVSRATIWRWAGTGRLPAPVKLSEGVTRWELAKIEAFESKRARA